MLSKKILFISLLFISIVFGYVFFLNPRGNASELNFNTPKIIRINDNGLDFIINTSATTVEDVLRNEKIEIKPNDQIFPNKTTVLSPNMHIRILRAVNIKILADNQVIENHTTQNNIPLILAENNISLGKLDKVEPDIHTPPKENMQIAITRINVEEKIIPEEIDFKTTINTDSKMGWREEKITQEGKKGVVETKYRITYKNNKEVSRVVLEKNITQEPITQIKTMGTYMKLGGAVKGQGTWYSYMGGLFAASTTIPKGEYAKVTNTANGKSVVVQINDYGPQGKGRIIDLDKVAFAKIAAIGAGVAGVKVEHILN